MSDQTRSRRVAIVRLGMRRLLAGAACCLLALAWLSVHPPSAHAAPASGVPWCPNPLPDERTATRTAIHLNRAEGPIGTDLSVTASGWRPGAQVSLHFDARDPKSGELYVFMPQLARGVVARDRTVSLTALDAPPFFCVDMYSPDTTSYRFDQDGGTTAFFVLVGADGEVSAPVAFRYLPAPKIALGGLDTLGAAKVGATITITGSDWEAHEPLTLTLQAADPAAHNAPVPYAAMTHATTDATGSFTASYPLDRQLRWTASVQIAVEGTGPRFGALVAYGTLSLAPAVQPTFLVDRTTVTPGMAITVSGEHWYPGDSFVVKYCGARWGDGGWSDGPDCGKEANPALGAVTIDTQGRFHQRLIIPAREPVGVIMVGLTNLEPWYNHQQIAVHVVAHLPTWDEIHPRVAALRDRLVGSLPFTVPALVALAFAGARRRRRGRTVG